ncbi:hypothetical protein ACTXT7_006023 [Hymenolepis weldensis]
MAIGTLKRFSNYGLNFCDEGKFELDEINERRMDANSFYTKTLEFLPTCLESKDSVAYSLKSI